MDRKELNVMEHLEELRGRMIKTLLAFLLFFIISFIYVEHIYQWLIKDLDQKLAVLGPSDILWVY
ncbi:twin-arginine translocase subunit TatC, partial [Neobacillus vireti]